MCHLLLPRASGVTFYELEYEYLVMFHLSDPVYVPGWITQGVMYLAMEPEAGSSIPHRVA